MNFNRGLLVLLPLSLLATTSSFVQADQPMPVDFSNAEVIVTSSSNTAFVGMVNTDAQGRFILNGVPAGGISLVIRRNGVVIAHGAGVTEGGSLNEAQVLDITLVPISSSLKSGLAK